MKKLAISCTDRSLQADVDPRFGRAAYFCIYDLDADSCEFIDNEQSLNSPSGAGVQAAQTILNADVSDLLTGHCGPKAFRALSAAGVSIYTNVAGTVQEAVSAYKKNRLVVADAADVEGHW